MPFKLLKISSTIYKKEASKTKAKNWSGYGIIKGRACNSTKE